MHNVLLQSTCFSEFLQANNEKYIKYIKRKGGRGAAGDAGDEVYFFLYIQIFEKTLQSFEALTEPLYHV